MRKKLCTTGFMLLLILSLTLSGQVCQAKTKNVTKSFKGKKQVQKMLQVFESQLNCYGIKSTEKLDFSKKKDREKILRWMINDDVIQYQGKNSVSQYSQYLFGKKAKTTAAIQPSVPASPRSAELCPSTAGSVEERSIES